MRSADTPYLSAPLDDVAAARVEPRERALQACAAVVGALRILDRRGRIRIRRRQVGGGAVGLLVVCLRGRVEGQVARREALLHLRDLARADTQVAGHRGGLLGRQPAEILFQTTQIEEELALRLGGGDLDEPPVAQHVLVDLRADPVNREGHQPHVQRRIEALDGLHEADVAFLDEVSHRQPIAAVAARDVHHEPQVRQHQLSGGVEIALGAEALGECALLRAGKDGNAADALEVGIETTERAGQCLIAHARNQRGTCSHRISRVLSRHSSSRAIRVLKAPEVPPEPP